MDWSRINQEIGDGGKVMGEQLARRAPHEAGVSAKHIGDFFARIESEGLALHSVMILRHGFVVAEHWWSPYSPDKRHMLFSLSKSFTSTAIGLAVSEGLLTEDDTVLSFFPEYRTPDIDSNMADMRIRHLLSMSTGHTEDTMRHLHRAEDGDFARAFFSVPIQKPPGTHFLYNTGATYMLSAILQRVTGVTLLDYLTPRLFQPLGIENPTWESCPRGVNMGGFGLSVRTEDIAKFGQMYLQQGVWNGRQVVPSDWVSTATRSHVSNGDQPDSDWSQGYGYQFWRCRHNVYRGDGAFGQYCVVMPEQDAVVAITSGLNDMQAVLNVVWDTILPGMNETSGATSPSRNEIELYKPADSLPGPNGSSTKRDGVPSWNGQTLLLQDNELNWTSIQLTQGANSFTVDLAVHQQHSVLSGGYGTWIEGRATVRAGVEESIAVQGGWTDENTFVFALCLSETPFTMTVEVREDTAGCKLHVKQNVGFGDRRFELVGTSQG